MARLYHLGAILASLLLTVRGAEDRTNSSGYYDGYETVDSKNYPVQIRMSFQGPTAMMVSWNTFAKQNWPTVHYGTKPNKLSKHASSDVSVTYPTSLTYNNHVNITNLEPDTMYYYLPHGSNATTPFSFRTSRPAGDMKSFTAAIIVDMGTFGPLGLSQTSKGVTIEPGQHTTIQSVSNQLNDFDFVHHAGDLSYADAWLKEELDNYLPNTPKQDYPVVYEHINNAFYDELLNITSVKPYMVSPGNHEANCDNGGTTDKATGTVYTEKICAMGQTNFTGFINRFRMPSGPSGGQGNFWYSYDYGMAHFVSIDTETNLGHGLTGPDEGSPEFSGPFGLQNQQINWLKHDLASVDRSKTPWVVVFGHRPFYDNTGGTCDNCSIAFEGIFNRYGVDLYYTGHSHVYERFAPTFDNKTDPNGLNNPKFTWYIVNGAAGHYNGLDTFNYPLLNNTVYAQDTAYSWSKLIFEDAEHLTVQAIYSANSTVYDQATLYKKRK